MTLVSESDPPGVETKDVKLQLSEPCQHVNLHANNVCLYQLKGHLDFTCLILALWLCQETSHAFAEQ